ncbi:MAG: cyclic nucleotide-binding protein [Betaproteobacteria bacterium HGW-Betaproteobacteria-12]|nr:MAG: cyclic nucleotide-binding protein [Betaproteobacteria bacterium HGW-Betaproteobacteria-12]
MHDELAEIRDFVAECPPFDGLDEAALKALTPRFVIRYLRRGTDFPPPGQPCLWLVRQGAIELRTSDGALARRMGEGDLHDADCLADSPERTWRGHSVEDTLLYGLPRADLEDLWQAHPALRQRALHDLGQRLAGARSSQHLPPERDLGSLPLAMLVGRAPVCTSPEASIREAARHMSRERVSALLVVDEGGLLGIVTDRDLRSRCLAAGLSEQMPISAIMTADPLTLPPDAPGFEALLAMTRRGIHHLPVAEPGKLHGLVSSTDLLRAQGISSIHLADRIRRAGNLGDLATLAGELPELWLNLARRGEGAAILGRIVSGLADTIAGRLLGLAEEHLGPPPVPYAWIAYGSQGRQEQTLHSDQDNALILDDDYDAEQHGEYFAGLAREVCDGLAACGFMHCPGAMMATNPDWRQPLAAWRELFTDWISSTDPQKGRLASNLFDLRVVHGEPALARPLRQLITSLAPRHETLLTHLVANGCATPPPLGFFRQLVVTGSGEHEGELDIKRHGILPIVDLARIHALAAGVGEIGTLARLRGTAGQALLSRDGAETLISAFDFLLALRTRHQLEQLLAGQPAGNYLAPARLGAADRRHLRDVFLAITTQQKALLHAFPHGPIR